MAKVLGVSRLLGIDEDQIIRLLGIESKEPDITVSQTPICDMRAFSRLQCVAFDHFCVLNIVLLKYIPGHLSVLF